MELNDHYRNVEEEESSLLKRLIALKSMYEPLVLCYYFM